MFLRIIKFGHRAILLAISLAVIRVLDHGLQRKKRRISLKSKHVNKSEIGFRDLLHKTFEVRSAKSI